MRLLSSNMPEIAKIRAIKHIRRMPVYSIVYVVPSRFYNIFTLKYLHLVFPKIAQLGHIGNRSRDYCSCASTHHTAQN
jgi:hypothetical protein